MPSEKLHIAQASHNLSFLESFYSSYNYSDWSITVAFYSSIHIVEGAICFKKKIKYLGKDLEVSHSDQLPGAIKKAGLTVPENLLSASHHSLRGLIVNENFIEIREQYNLLYSNSRTARYRQYSWQKHEVELIVKPAIKEIIKWSNKECATTSKIDFK